jgi:MFS family permease
MLLRHASTFRRLWVGQSVSVIGDGMQRIALLWWAKQHGGNALLVAVALSTMVPVVVCSPIGGWLADHADRRRLLVGADLVRVVTSGSIASLLLGGDPPELLVCLLVAVAATATASFDPAYAATVPSVVDDADLPAANGLNMANGAVGGLVGPLLGGLLIGMTDIGWVLVVNACTFAWSAVCVASCRLPSPERATGVPAEKTTSRMRSSLNEVRRVPGLGPLIGLAAMLNMAVAPVPMMLAALAIDRLGAGPRLFGALEVLLSAGLLVGALGAGRLATGRLTPPFLLLGCCLACVGLVPVAGVAISLMVGGVAIAVANTEAMTRFQRGVPAAMHGRVFGVVGSMSEGLRPLGLAAGGPLLAVAGVSGAFVVVGAVVVLSTLVWARGVRVVDGSLEEVVTGPAAA